MSISQYLLESSVCLGAFYLFYYLMLRKETFFQLNRFYLLMTPLVSLVLPLLNITLRRGGGEQPLDIFYPAVVQAELLNQFVWRQIEKPTSAFSLSIGDILMIVYGIGVVIMASILVRSLWRLFRIIRQSRRLYMGDMTMVDTDGLLPAASFFSYVFWNDEKVTEEKRLILEHEMVHIRQWHSLDVLLMELWVIIKWFNPLIYLYRKSLKATHEYIADNYMVSEMGSRYQYAQFLVHSHPQSCHPLANTFAALITKRLKMLKRQPSQFWRSLKYLLSLPLLMVLMALFSFNLSEQLPNSLLQPLGQAEEYLEEWKQQTVWQMPQKEEKNFGKNYIQWGKTRLPLKWINGGDTRSGRHFIPLDSYQKMLTLPPQLFVNGQKTPISSTALVIDNEEEVQACQSFYWEDELYLNRLMEKISKKGRCIFLFKTENEKLFQMEWVVGNDFFDNALEDMPSDMMALYGNFLSEMSYRSLKTPSRLHPGYKKTQPYFVTWGDFQIPIAIKTNPDNFGGSLYISAEKLEQMLYHAPVFHELQATPDIKNVQLMGWKYSQNATETSIMERLYTTFRDKNNALLFESGFSKGTPGRQFIPNMLNKQGSLDSKDIHTIIEAVEEGFRKFHFSFEIDSELQHFSIDVHLEGITPWLPPAKKTMEISSDVSNFQFITRKNQRSIIKMDTSNQKYRWMYEKYKDGKQLDIIHIPDFKTIHRVLTLEDEIVAKEALGETVSLANHSKNIHTYPEYHDFFNAEVGLHWRDAVGLDEPLSHSLSSFQESDKQEVELFLNNEQLNIQQMELLIVPEKGQAMKVITDRTDRLEICELVNQLQPRTSIYLRHFLIKKWGELLHFPVTFPIHLDGPPSKKIQPLGFFPKKAPEKESYQIQWGNMECDCPKSVNSSYYCPSIFLTLEEFQQNYSNDFQVEKNGKTVNPYGFSISLNRPIPNAIDPDATIDYMPHFDKDAAIWQQLRQEDAFYLKFMGEGRDMLGFYVVISEDKDRSFFYELQIGNTFHHLESSGDCSALLLTCNAAIQQLGKNVILKKNGRQLTPIVYLRLDNQTQDTSLEIEDFYKKTEQLQEAEFMKNMKEKDELLLHLRGSDGEVFDIPIFLLEN